MFKTKEHISSIGFPMWDNLNVAGGRQVQSPFSHTHVAVYFDRTFFIIQNMRHCRVHPNT